MNAIYQLQNVIDNIIERSINLQAMPGDTIFTSDIKLSIYFIQFNATSLDSYKRIYQYQFPLKRPIKDYSITTKE